MAKCEVCGFEQFPFNTRVVRDEAGKRHFFCSDQHAKLYQEQGVVQITVEEVIEEEKAAASAPETPEIEREESFVCEECGFEAKSEAGLVAHMRAKHKK